MRRRGCGDWHKILMDNGYIIGGKVEIESNVVLLIGTVAISSRCSFEVYLSRRCSASDTGVNAKQG